MKSNRNIIKVGAALATGSSIIERIIIMAIGFLMAKLLGAALFGEYSLTLTIVTMAYTISLVGFDLGLIKFLTRYETHSAQGCDPSKDCISFALLIVFLFSLCLGLSLFFSRNWLTLFFEKDSIAKMLLLMVPFIPLGSLTVIVANVFNAKGSYFWYAVLVRILRPGFQLIFFVLCFCLIPENAKFYSAPLSFSFSLLLCGTIALVLVKKHDFWKLSLAVGYTEKKKLIYFSAPLFLTSVLSIGINWLDILVLGHFAPAHDVGIYSVASRLANLILLPLFGFSALLPTVSSKLWEMGDLDELRKSYRDLSFWILLSSIPLLLLFCLVGKEALSVFGQEYIAGYVPLIILSFGKTFFASLGSIGHVLTMISRPKLNFINNALFFVVNIVLCWILIPKYGILGAAISTSMAIVLVNLMRYLEIFFIIKLNPLQGRYFKVICISIPVYYAFWCFKENILPIGIWPLAAFSLSFLLFLTGAFYFFALSQEQRAIMLSMAKRLIPERI